MLYYCIRYTHQKYIVHPEETPVAYTSVDTISDPAEAGLQLLSGRWKARLLWKLHLRETWRFGELRRALPGVTPRMLTRRLRELERDGLVRRRVYAVVPPRVEYSLSPFGRTLDPVFRSLAAWGEDHRRDILQLLSSWEEPA
jgi:DNA-binding HxlR family transcriptional regulator